jgi:hypothetical protein
MARQCLVRHDRRHASEDQDRRARVSCPQGWRTLAVGRADPGTSDLFVVGDVQLDRHWRRHQKLTDACVRSADGVGDPPARSAHVAGIEQVYAKANLKRCYPMKAWGYRFCAQRSGGMSKRRSIDVAS